MTLEEHIAASNILMVGAGGIGCELLKNLVLSGFNKISIIDLDTIDISNLNRQFLFQKEHVGKSKAQVARDSALQFNPDANVVSYHDSIMSTKYDVEFFRQFNIVMNALDNRAARSHVNRMCLAADVPLIESGTAGYLGQVNLIKKQMTECYDCKPNETQKSYPGCTIRNTPSELIHCVVWAKHLFNQLFGESDPDQDVSPDTEDPEAAGDAGKTTAESVGKTNAIGGIERKSTRVWAEEGDYNADKLLHKFFHDDIVYLLSMANLWKKRTPPQPLNINSLPTDENGHDCNVINEQQIWSLKKCVSVFTSALFDLKKKTQVAGKGSTLVWDKDDDASLDFVTSAANIRASIFHIPVKSKFDIKAMAGNIIPAIATTNAIIAGMIVLEAFKILNNQLHLCRAVFFNRYPNPRKKLLIPCPLDPPNSKCYVCSEKNEISVLIVPHEMTVKSFEEKILKGALGMVAPDVEIDNGKGTILISSEEGETEDNNDKVLTEFNIGLGTRLKCDDFLQEYSLVVNIIATEKLPEEKDFEIVGDVNDLLKGSAEEMEAPSNEPNNTYDKNKVINDDDDDEDLLILESDEENDVTSKADIHKSDVILNHKRKRRPSTNADDEIVPKKRASAGPLNEDLMIID